MKKYFRKIPVGVFAGFVVLCGFCTNKNRRIKAFSLVEILVALIIISLITAAIAPVITKKLSSAGITIVGGGSGGGSGGGESGDSSEEEEEEEPEYVSKIPDCQEDCDPYNAHYFNGSCITKANAGDDAYNGPSIENLGIDIKTTGTGTSSKCTSGNCCWQGKTGKSCNTYTGSTYSSCYRTACTWEAAKTACENYDINGTKGQWSLPSVADLQAWKGQIESELSASTALLTRWLGPNGLDLCESSGDGKWGSAWCSADNVCPTSLGGTGCWIAGVWGSKVSASIAYRLLLTDNTATVETYNMAENGQSARCVLKKVHVQVRKPKKDPNEGVVFRAPKSQKDCDVYGAHYFNGTCISKANAGDSVSTGTISYSGPSLGKPIYTGASLTDLGIEILPLNGSCTTNTCCWQGKTGKSCRTYTGSSYDGCNRTICDWYAADVICKNHDVAGTNSKGLWSLPTSSELQQWKVQVSADASASVALLTLYMGEKGLDLCEESGDGGWWGAAWCSHNTTCATLGSGTGCYPAHVWGEATSATSSDAHVFWLEDYTPALTTAGKNSNGRSVRCVLRKVPSTLNVEEEKTVEEDKTIYKTPTSQADCELYNAHYFNNTCITRANAGDVEYGGPALKIKSEVQTNSRIQTDIGVEILGMGDTCTTNVCCWQGKTAATCNSYTGSSYSGCYRTVCDWYAADVICKNHDVAGTNSRGKWELPTNADLLIWQTQLSADASASVALLSRYMGTKGLDLCESTGDGNWGSAWCYRATTCPTPTGGTGCYPSYIWANENSKTNAYTMVLSDSTATIESLGKVDNGRSVRCLIRKVIDTGAKEEENKLIEYITPSSQVDCDPYGAHYFNNSCITKANAGDIVNNITSPSIKNIGIQVLSVGQTCTTNTCCWQGRTGDKCSTYDNSAYSGCNRTICDWYAADVVCSNYNPDGNTKGLWKLPTYSDLIEWRTQNANDNSTGSSKLSRYLGKNGLDLCESSGDGTWGAAWCSTAHGCNTPAGGTGCYANCVWGERDGVTAYAHNLLLTDNVASIQSSSLTSNGRSVRCVLKKIPKEAEM